MSRKPTLSPSKLTTYLACPLKYRWTYVDPRGKWYLKSKSYYSFGTTLHRVLERFHDAGDTGVETTHQALAALEENWVDAGFSSADEMAEAFGEGKAILERYVEERIQKPIPGKTLHVEKLFRMDMGEFDLVGRVDRVDEHEDGSLEIVDYKSGRGTVDVDDVSSDIAMSCYQVLLRNQYPDRQIKATIVAIRSGIEASYSMPLDEMEEFVFDLKELGHRIMCHDYYELVPVAKGLCPQCDFLRICRKHDEFDLREIAEESRT